MMVLTGRGTSGLKIGTSKSGRVATLVCLSVCNVGVLCPNGHLPVSPPQQKGAQRSSSLTLFGPLYFGTVAQFSNCWALLPTVVQWDRPALIVIADRWSLWATAVNGFASIWCDEERDTIKLALLYPTWYSEVQVLHYSIFFYVCVGAFNMLWNAGHLTSLFDWIQNMGYFCALKVEICALTLFSR